jgi:hypothetical protein
MLQNLLADMSVGLELLKDSGISELHHLLGPESALEAKQ